MPLYHVGVVRSYGVTIEAEDPEKAEELAAFFLGNCVDASNDEERVRFNFKIQKIELAENDSFLIH
jgi:hypothetical protein